MLPRTLEDEVMDTVEEAAGYDAMDHSRPNTAFVERLVKLGARGRMLDIGTGPGRIPIMLAERVAAGTVVGVDASHEMLKLARRYGAQSAVAGRVSFEFADAKQLPFDDNSFDTVFSNTIMHHIPQPRAMVAEAARVLRPGGVLLIRDLFRPADVETVEALVREYSGEDTPYQQQLFRASLHAALTPAEFEAIAAELGLADVEVVIDSDRHMSLQSRAVAASGDGR